MLPSDLVCSLACFGELLASSWEEACICASEITLFSMPRGATQAKFVEERTGLLAGLLYHLRFLIVYILFDIFSFLFTVSPISTIVLNTLDTLSYYCYC